MAVLKTDLKDIDLKSFLEEKYQLYNNSSFIESDPIQVPHQFHQKEDIEITAFLTALIAWGQRKSIIKNANYLISLLENEPHQFVLNASKHELKSIEKFVHRTFNGSDAIEMILALQIIYRDENGLENVFIHGKNTFEKIEFFHLIMKNLFTQDRTVKHISSPGKGSAAKRLNMFLRWMVRNDKKGVDFGLWKTFSPSDLICPLDVHSGNAARKLGLLKRVQNDWQAAEELTQSLRIFDPTDPVKYDFALFGLGVFEKF